jgi:tetratricopeptide (TPR) repeat protein
MSKNWDILVAGRSSEAVEIFKREFENSPDAPTACNLGIALLDCERYEEARSAFRCAADIEAGDGTSAESTFLALGTAEWLLGDEVAAIETWKRSLGTAYGDAAGGVEGPAFLWYGAVRTGNEKLRNQAVRLMRGFWNRKIKENAVDWWPGPRAFAGFLLGEVDDHTFVDLWKCDNEILEQRRLCKVHFWAGVKSEDRDTAREHFRRAFSDSRRAILEFEYFLSKNEFAATSRFHNR